RAPTPPLFPYTTLFRSLLAEPRGLPRELGCMFDAERRNPDAREREVVRAEVVSRLRLRVRSNLEAHPLGQLLRQRPHRRPFRSGDRKSTRLNSSHRTIS